MKNQPGNAISLLEKRKSTVSLSLLENLSEDRLKPVLPVSRIYKADELELVAEKVTRLRLNIIALLKKEFTYENTISTFKDLVVIHVTSEDYEQRLGVLVQKMQKIIDQHCPEREANLFIVVRNYHESKEIIFKVWKSV